ncbi:MAG: CHAD domain-containing protein [Cyanobacteria bacterium J06560_2]
MTQSIETTAPNSNDLGLSGERLEKDATKLGGYAYQIIRQQSKQVFKLRGKVLADTDIENLHQMRIGTRRLRSALVLFADVIDTDAIDTDEAKKQSALSALVEPVKGLTKSLGKVRDLDVMQAWFSAAIAKDTGKANSRKANSRKANSAAITGFSKKEKKVIESLLKKLQKRRKKQFSKLETTLKSKAYKRLAKRCKQWIKHPSFGPAAQQPAATSAISRIVTPLTELLLHPGWQIATQQKGKQLLPVKGITLAQLNQQIETDSEQLHALRKQIKQTRYQTEFFRSIYGITYAAQIREFRTLQKVLGQLQDQLVISEFLTQEIGENWAKQLPTIEQAFQASRLDLWQQWQPLQAKYLALSRQANVAA